VVKETGDRIMKNTKNFVIPEAEATGRECWSVSILIISQRELSLSCLEDIFP
jgi:hypothetical protein